MIEPWKELSGLEVASVRKLARLLMAMEVDEDCTPLRPAMGQTGYQVGKELLAFADVKEGKAKRKEKAQEKQQTAAVKDGTWEAAQRIINTFGKMYEEALGCPPPVENRGAQINLLRKHFKGGWKEELILKVMPAFFNAGRNIKENNNRFLFGKGNLRSFCSVLPKLKAALNVPSQSATTPIPQSVRKPVDVQPTSGSKLPF